VKKRIVLIPLSLVAGGCGYVGETQPPSLHLPAVVHDLSVVERGDRLIVQFTVPATTTDGLPLKDPAKLELHIDDKTMPISTADPIAHFETSAQPFYGKVAAISLRALGTRNRDAGPSNVINLAVVPAIPEPVSFKVEAVSEGIELSWQSTEKKFAIYRQAPDEKELTKYETVTSSPFVDRKTVYDKPYVYAIQAVADSAESEVVKAVRYTADDHFAPAVPVGLAAVVGTQSVELVWERDIEPDLAGYRVYRDAGTGQFERIGVATSAPNFSDKTAEKGKRYRYAVTAFDQSGNESALSEPFEVALP
jgi:hypothetical protein